MPCNTFKLSHEVSLVFPNIDWRRDILLPPPQLRGPVDESNLCLALGDSNDYSPSSSGGGSTAISELCLSWFRNPVISATIAGSNTQVPTTHYLLQWSLSEDFTTGTVQERILANPPVFDYYYYCLTYPNEFRNDETIYWRVTAANLNQGAVSPPSEIRKLTLNCSDDENSEKSKYDIKDEIIGCETLCLDECCLFGVTSSFKTPKPPNPDAIEITKTEWGVETCDGTVQVSKDDPQNQNGHVLLDMASENDPNGPNTVPDNENTLLITSISDTPQVIKVCVRKTYKYVNENLNRDDFECTTCKKVLLTQCGSKSRCIVKFKMPCNPIEPDSCEVVTPIEYSDGRTLRLDDSGQVKDIVVCNCKNTEISCDCCGYGYAICWDGENSTLPDDVPSEYVFDENEEPDSVQRHAVFDSWCNECCKIRVVNGQDKENSCPYLIPPVGDFKGRVLNSPPGLDGYEVDVEEFQNTIVYDGCEPDRTFVPGDDLVMLPESALSNPFDIIEIGDQVIITVTEDCEVTLSRACILTNDDDDEDDLCLLPGDYCVEVVNNSSGGGVYSISFDDHEFQYEFAYPEGSDSPCGQHEVGDKLTFILNEDCIEDLVGKCILVSASPGSPDIIFKEGCETVRILSKEISGPDSSFSDLTRYVVRFLTGEFIDSVVFVDEIAANFNIGECAELCVDECCVFTMEPICGRGLTDGKCYPGTLADFTQHSDATTRVYIEEASLTDIEKECVPEPFEIEANWWSNACGIRQDKVQVCVHNCEVYAYLSGINIHSSDIGNASADEATILGEMDGCIVHIDTEECEEDGGSGSNGLTSELNSGPLRQGSFIPVEE